MAGSVLARRDRALTPDEQVELLRDRLGDDAITGMSDASATLTVDVAPDRWVEVAERCRDEEQLAYDLFDCLFGIDARDDGFDVVCVLYATSTGTRLALRARCPGGREAPTLGSLTGLFRGADWHERETWDMFGIEFEGHPGLAPRILTVENFDGWPLRKDFPLASRVAKPWPGVKEPAELDEDGNVIEREPRLGDAPGPYELDKAMAEQAKLANPVPETASESGAAVEDRAEDADLASDSGAVLAGDIEHEAERAEEQASEAAVEAAADVADAEADAAATATEAREVDGATDADAAASARETADDARKRQAEARARKAEERRAEAEAAGAAASGGPTSSEPETGGTASADGGAPDTDEDRT
ncbi:NADH-quinone oxidoreductase subunit C [Nitriliruptor alkaliphilus]|uniref:NADH-quinone oxidoreductase subunit C n=1 Tax=Nitriliruptor alkaliphilus TaxID=427918 RepID=UPI000697EA59|nr:NADH-quinone oxidoreductase subunit C [Nitriliruptor alkaliphilus]